jgi:hypothetical protein
MAEFKLMSTRYSDYGINTISDVEICSFDKNIIKIKNEKKQIYHIRLDYTNNSIYSAWDVLNYFNNNIINTITNKFIVIITGEDLTFPNQVDVRWKKIEQVDLIKKTYNLIISHPLLIHCYIENRDEEHPKTSSLPLGINPREMPNMNCDYILKFIDNHIKLTERPLKVICIHRDRDGDRQIINKYKNTTWKNYTITNGNYKYDSWYKLLQTYPFIICAHGGGIDPCPKVWEALCLGCIPIIKHSALDDIYMQFPVIFVDEFNEDTINEDNLKKWISEYNDFYDNPEKTKLWKDKLYLEYWKCIIQKKLQDNIIE